MTVSDTEAEDLIIYAKTRENGKYSARCPGCWGERMNLISGVTDNEWKRYRSRPKRYKLL